MFKYVQMCSDASIVFMKIRHRRCCISTLPSSEIPCFRGIQYTLLFDEDSHGLTHICWTSTNIKQHSEKQCCNGSIMVYLPLKLQVSKACEVSAFQACRHHQSRTSIWVHEESCNGPHQKLFVVLHFAFTSFHTPSHVTHILTQPLTQLHLSQPHLTPAFNSFHTQ